MTSLTSILKRLNELTFKKVGLLTLYRKKVIEAELHALRSELANYQSGKDDNIK